VIAEMTVKQAQETKIGVAHTVNAQHAVRFADFRIRTATSWAFTPGLKGLSKKSHSVLT
jgi:hypothetical protein